MSEDQLYLLALGIAMRFHFDLCGDDPEEVFATLQQCDPDADVDDALYMCYANPVDKLNGDVSFMLASIQTLIDDIMDSFRNPTK